MELAVTPEEVTATIVEIRQTEERFGLGLLANGAYRVLVPPRG